MSNYNELKKIIPPDQALANEALSRGLRQVKEIFNSDLPALSQAVSNLESNKDLNLINALETPLPANVISSYQTVIGTGTGPGNTITTNDLLGTAAGNTHVTELPIATNVLVQLNSLGALNPLTANGGAPGSAINGVYTVMQYTLANSYTGVNPGPPVEYSITIPAPLPGQGSYGPDGNFTTVIDAAFANLISIANARINTIASTYPTQTQQANDSFVNMSGQIGINVINCQAATIDVANLVANIASANLVPNSKSTVLNLTTQLQDLGRDVTEGGTAQFFEQIADTTTLSGQAVIASMREGRNIAVLNDAGIKLDTQLTDVNLNQTVANNLANAQYSVSEARANIVI